MSTPTPPSVVAAFTFGGTPGTDYTLIPVPSQVGVSPELASFTTGFPPATRLARTSGGIPPRGLDMNGILFMLSGNIAWLASGNAYPFNTDVVAVAGGYRVGAILQSAVTPTKFFYNTLANNTNDPDSVLTGWTTFSPLSNPTTVQTPSALPAGVTNDLAITGATGFLELSANAAGSTLTSLAGGSDGQIIVISNVSANPLDLASLTGPTPANQFRFGIPSLSLLQNDSVSFRKSVSIGKWVKI